MKRKVVISSWIVVFILALVIVYVRNENKYVQLEGKLGEYDVYVGVINPGTQCDMILIWDSLVVTEEKEYGFSTEYDDSTCNTSIYLKVGLKRITVQEAFDQELLDLDEILEFDYGRTIQSGDVFNVDNIIRIEVYDEKDGEQIYELDYNDEFDTLLDDFNRGFVPIRFMWVPEPTEIGYMILYSEEEEYHFILYSLFIQKVDPIDDELSFEEYLYTGFTKDDINYTIKEIKSNNLE